MTELTSPPEGVIYAAVISARGRDRRDRRGGWRRDCGMFAGSGAIWGDDSRAVGGRVESSPHR